LNGNNYVIDQGLSAPAGTTLTLNGSWSNASTISATNATVNLGGTFTEAALGVFQRAGGTVNLTGLLDNTGQTLALDATTGSWVLASGGTIKNGTVRMGGGAELIAAGGTLDGVTLACDLDLRANGASVHILDGLTLNGVTVWLGNGAGTTAGQMYFDNSERLGGTGTVVLGKNASNGIYVGGTGSTLTIGSGVTVRGSSGTLASQSWWSAGSIVNQGTIAADDSGGSGARRTGLTCRE
jgi:hypothetical protein